MGVDRERGQKVAHNGPPNGVWSPVLEKWDRLDSGGMQVGPGDTRRGPVGPSPRKMGPASTQVGRR